MKKKCFEEWKFCIAQAHSSEQLIFLTLVSVKLIACSNTAASSIGYLQGEGL